MGRMKWQTVRSTKSTFGPIIKVKRKIGKKTETGFFKSVSKQYENEIGFLPANELIAYRLGKLLKLNVAEVRLARVKGKTGVVSIVRPGSKHCSWEQLSRKVKGNVMRRIDKPSAMLRAFVFDIWIYNLDRHADNVITYPNGKKYGFYLIDHGLSLFGAFRFEREPWHSQHWDHVAMYNEKYVPGLTRSIRGYRQLAPYIRQIQRLPAAKIRRAIHTLPASVLPLSRKKLIEKALLNRRRKLPALLKRWIYEYKVVGLRPLD